MDVSTVIEICLRNMRLSSPSRHGDRLILRHVPEAIGGFFVRTDLAIFSLYIVLGKSARANHWKLACKVLIHYLKIYLIIRIWYWLMPGWAIAPQTDSSIR